MSQAFFPNVAAKWLAFLLRIWEVPDLNIGQKTGHPD
jgi:hypothetical protein